MRSTLFFTLLLFIAAVNCGPLQSNCDDSNASEAAAVQCGNDVKLVRPGYVELVVSSDSLFVDVDIDSCIGKVLFCYAAKSDEMMQTPQALCPKLSNFCGFQLSGTDDKISFISTTSYEKRTNALGVCSNEIKMEFRQAKYCEGKNDESCSAAISPEDRRIEIHVTYASIDCPVIIKYAKIYVPPTTTPVPTTAHPSMAPSSNKTAVKNEDKAAEAAIWPWIVLGVGIALILIGIFIGLLICWIKKWCMFKKKTADISPPPRPAEEIISTTVEAKAEEKIEKEYEKIKAEHPELKEVISKKSKKASRPPPPPSAEPSKKPSPPPSSAKPAKKAKEMKAKTPPTAVAPSKKGLKEKKVAPASPGKKSVEKKAVRAPSTEKKVSKESTKTEGQPCSTEAYSPPFCLMPVRAPTPPVNPNGGNVNINRKPG